MKILQRTMRLVMLLTPVLAPFRDALADPVDPPVAIIETQDAYTLSNGYLTASISKSSGQLLQLRHEDLLLIPGDAHHPGGYWSHPPAGPNVTAFITLDPRASGGARGEVAIKAVCDGVAYGVGPGGKAVMDVQTRYALGRHDHGLYAYCILSHPAKYPATSIGEARFAMKLNAKIFDWMSIDSRRDKLMPSGADWDAGERLNMLEARRLTTGPLAGQVEHKYDYSAVQFDTPAYGWSSTRDHVGLWIINPSIEYLSGGATKVELTGHLDVNRGGQPTLLNYWRGSHYGGTHCDIAAGENWTKVVGPFFVYVNQAPTPAAMFADALAQAKVQQAQWPYDWVDGVDYPRRGERATATGRITLDDPAATMPMTRLLIGLSAPDEASSQTGRFAPIGGVVDWQQDARHYQFWTRGGADGRFTLSAIRPGRYTLHAIADGVLGEFTLPGVTLEAGQSLDLGALAWKPQRFGRQLWEIGMPDRTAGEFRHGDHYWQWGLYNAYPAEFPTDVNFTPGQSDPAKDWNYAQVPRDGKPTTWTIHFRLPAAQTGTATLRLALAGNSAKTIDITVNGQPAGNTGSLPDTGVVRRDGIRGYWFERDIPFPATMLKPGDNTLSLTIPGGNAYSGVEYDYLRLEVK